MSLMKPRDPASPGFPHGTSYGYTLESIWGKHLGQQPAEHCAPCRRARTAQQAARSRRKAYGRLGPQDLVDAAPVNDHLDRLLQSMTLEQIAQEAGMSYSAMRNLRMNRRRKAHVSNATRVLAVKPREGRRISGQYYREAGEFHLRRLQLAALGYPSRWQFRQMCTSYRGLGNFVAKGLWDRQTELMHRIGDTPADPARDGLTEFAIGRAKLAARKAGVYPPCSYDEDGTLHLLWVPDHSAARLEEKAGRYLDDLRLLLDRWVPGYATLKEVATQAAGDVAVSTAEQRLRRAAKDAGIYDDRPARDVTARHAERVLDRYDRGEITALHASYYLNLIRPSKAQAETRHPGVTAWQQEQHQMSVRQCQLLVARLLSERAPEQELAA